MRGKNGEIPDDGSDFIVVPLAIPITVGPATIGTLILLSGEMTWPLILGLLLATLTVSGILLTANIWERIFKERGIKVLSKITGLILAALAAQITLTGIQNFLT